ncbi:hypothetical protein RRSWK_00255 [Rhodopirellula sp. SWK7]|nr:hypothetical protein RRSWK_00255 [Rhodopirellula sp. SWK7]
MGILTTISQQSAAQLIERPAELIGEIGGLGHVVYGHFVVGLEFGGMGRRVGFGVGGINSSIE